METSVEVSLRSKFRYEAFCLKCCGGGKTLMNDNSRKAVNFAATAHMNRYGCDVTVIDHKKQAA